MAFARIRMYTEVNPEETTRYLGQQVVTQALTHVNWSVRIRKVRRRLETVTHVARFVSIRVPKLDVKTLPGVPSRRQSLLSKIGDKGDSGNFAKMFRETIRTLLM